MFKVNYKDTRMWRSFTHFSSVSIVNFEEVNADWYIYAEISVFQLLNKFTGHK